MNPSGAVIPASPWRREAGTPSNLSPRHGRRTNSQTMRIASRLLLLPRLRSNSAAHLRAKCPDYKKPGFDRVGRKFVDEERTSRAEKRVEKRTFLILPSCLSLPRDFYLAGRELENTTNVMCEYSVFFHIDLPAIAELPDNCDAARESLSVTLVVEPAPAFWV